MGKELKKLSKEQIKKLIDHYPDYDKATKDKYHRRARGKGIYCSAIKKKVDVDPSSIKYYLYDIGNNKYSVQITGTSKECKKEGKDGKKVQAEARTILLNQRADYVKSIISGRSMSRPKRGKSKPKRGKSKPKRGKSKGKSKGKRGKSRSKSKGKRGKSRKR